MFFSSKESKSISRVYNTNNDTWRSTATKIWYFSIAKLERNFSGLRREKKIYEPKCKCKHNLATLKRNLDKQAFVKSLKNLSRFNIFVDWKSPVWNNKWITKKLCWIKKRMNLYVVYTSNVFTILYTFTVEFWFVMFFFLSFFLSIC